MAGRHARRPEGPVFVDPSGRRSTAVRSVGWLVAAVVVGYLLLVAVALVGPPGLSRVTVPGIGPVLPGPGAAGIDGGRTSREAPGVVLERSPTPSRTARVPPSPARPSASPAAGATSSSPSPVPTRATGRPSPTASVTPSPTPRRTGRPSQAPKPQEPPGASRRPTRSPG